METLLFLTQNVTVSLNEYILSLWVATSDAHGILVGCSIIIKWFESRYQEGLLHIANSATQTKQSQKLRCMGSFISVFSLSFQHNIGKAPIRLTQIFASTLRAVVPILCALATVVIATRAGPVARIISASTSDVSGPRPRNSLSWKGSRYY